MPLSAQHKEILELINNASVYDVAKKTHLDLMHLTSKELDNHIYLKREDTQPVHSFKIRGAHNKIASLSDAEKKAGVIASSAGNHAQGVAFSCQEQDIYAMIVMPETTPPIKVTAVKSFGADVLLHGDSYDDAYAKALQIAEQKNLSFVHPYDDKHVIAGQGTIAKEILDDLRDKQLDYIFVAVGGGGLISGIATYIKAMSPNTKIIAVEAEDSACLNEALKAGDRVILDQVGIFADGVAVKQIGKLPFEICKDLIDDTVLVKTDEICASIKDIYDDIRAISEPAGALSLAGIKKYIAEHKIKNKNIAGILCGANVNFHRLRHISERAQIGEHEEALFAVKIPEQRGSFLKFCKALAGKSITEFNYRYQHNSEAVIFVGVELKYGENERQDILRSLKDQGYLVSDLTDNETAKLHIRYMIGGKTKAASDEVLYRFQFPERPGALLNFLIRFGTEFDISLFHYRNHGSAYGRVLAGIQVPEEVKGIFELRLKELNYVYHEESNNPAYSLFL